MHLLKCPFAAVALASLVCACESGSGPDAQSAVNDSGVSFVPLGDSGSQGEDSATPTQPSQPEASTLEDSSAQANSGDAAADAGSGIDSSVPGYTLTWSDEFNGPDGTPPDPSKWTYDIGGSGWGNDEREYFTNALANSEQQGGNLVITATPDGASSDQCWYGTCSYTSARINTSGLFSQAYGRFEARAQMPFGQGLWPAFWMLGSNIDSVSWPTCGENRHPRDDWVRHLHESR